MTEAELCDSFMAQARSEGLVAYPETCGWDVLVVNPITGRQCGVEAKLTPSVKVLSQALVPYDFQDGPTIHAVLIPSAPKPEFRAVAIACNLTIFALADWGDGAKWRGGRRNGVVTAQIEATSREWAHPGPHALPSVIPTGRAGLPAPVRWTKWKAAASTVLARLELRGHVTSADFRDAGITSSQWVQSGWLRDSGQRDGRRTVWVRGDMPDNLPPQQHPVEYAQVRARVRETLAADGAA